MTKYFLLLVCFLATFTAKTQDFQTSLHTSSPLSINPASTGFFNNDAWRIHARFRRENLSLQSSTLNNLDFSFDMRIPNKPFGVGYQGQLDQISDKGFNRITNQLAFSYNQRLSRDSIWNLSIGIMPSFMSTSIDGSKFSTPNRITLETGYSPLTLPAKKEIKSSANFDLGAGILLYSHQDSARIKPWLGLAVYHILEPNISMTAQEFKYPKKYIVSGGAELEIAKHFSFTPIFLIQNSGYTTLTQVGAIASIKGESIVINLGAYYNSDKYLVPMIGIRLENLELRVDFTTQKNSTNTGYQIVQTNEKINFMEVGLRYTFSNKFKKSTAFRNDSYDKFDQQEQPSEDEK